MLMIQQKNICTYDLASNDRKSVCFGLLFENETAKFSLSSDENASISEGGSKHNKGRSLL